jgi:uncharacterized protein DUF3892
MTELLITCVTQSSGVITHVGIGGKQETVQQVVDWVRNKVNDVYTNKAGTKVRVYAKPNASGNSFLTIDLNDTRENNLDFLPNCS